MKNFRNTLFRLRKENMIENNDNTDVKNTKKKYEFGKAFVNILFFPFRVIFFILKWSTRIILISFLVLILYIAIHGALPMQIPEAQGATFYQFMAERQQAEMKTSDYDPKFERQMFGYITYFYFAIKVYAIPFCDVFPENNKLEIISHCSEIPNSYKDMFRVPREDPKWTDLPSLVWETYERFMWEFYVKNSNLPEPDFTK